MIRLIVQWRTVLAHIVTVAMLTLFVAAPATAQRNAPTPELAFETSRFLTFPSARSPINPQGVVSISPQGGVYIARVLRGDIERNGVALEIWVGRISAGAAASPQLATTLFTSGLGPGGAAFFGPLINIDEYWADVRWIDERHVSFFWEDENEIRQVVMLDVDSHQLTFLTDSETHVTAYDANLDGDVVYSAMARLTPASIPTDHRGGIVISEGGDAYGLFQRDLSGHSLQDRRSNTEWFIDRRGRADLTSLRIAGRDIDRFAYHRIALAPWARAAILNSAPARVPPAWDRYITTISEHLIGRARSNPTELYARFLQQIHIVNLDRGVSRPLLDAPSFSSLTASAWSPNGGAVVLAPTYLPLDSSDERGLRGDAAAVVDARTGRYQILPITVPGYDPDTVVRWPRSNEIEILSEGILNCFQRRRTEWEAVTCPSETNSRLRFDLRENLETPPRLVAVDGSAETVLHDPNPGLLDQLTLGPTEIVQGRLDSETEWRGILFCPPNYIRGRRYPLVIQAVYGEESLGTNFTLYGSGEHTGPTTIAPYPGRMLASEGIVVLHLNTSIGSAAATPNEPRVRMRIFETVTRELIEAGIADQERIGLLGFSRNGWHVEYALTHSDFPFAAALVSDNFDPSYAVTLLMGQESTNSNVIGAEPFGQGLANWLTDSPGFNADRIRTPLRLVGQSFSLWSALLRWEVFSRAVHVGAPVEIYIMPIPDRGAHNPQNPQQILALQHGSIDWFNFWLRDFEDPDPRKSAQYARWRVMRERRDALEAVPRPPLLNWRVEAHSSQ